MHFCHSPEDQGYHSDAEAQKRQEGQQPFRDRQNIVREYHVHPVEPPSTQHNPYGQHDHVKPSNTVVRTLAYTENVRRGTEINHSI